MQQKRITVWLSFVTIAMLVLAGCAPRAGGGDTAKMATQQDLVIDLPAIVIDFNAQGEPSVGNVPVAQLASTFGVGNLDQLKVPPATIDMLSKANIQHVQVDNLPTGLTLIVNGEAIPSFAWDGKSLGELTTTLGKFGPVSPALEKLLPLQRRGESHQSSKRIYGQCRHRAEDQRTGFLQCRWQLPHCRFVRCGVYDAHRYAAELANATSGAG